MMKHFILGFIAFILANQTFAQDCTPGKGIFAPNTTMTRDLYWKEGKLSLTYKGAVKYVNTDNNRLVAHVNFQAYYKDGKINNLNKYKEITYCTAKDYIFSYRTIAEINGFRPMFLMERDDLINITEGELSFPIEGKEGDKLPDINLKGKYHLSSDPQEYPIEFGLTNRVYLGKESVTIASGTTFNCTKYSFSMSMNAGTLGRKNNDNITIWVSEGIIVKSEIRNNKGKLSHNSILSSFSK